MFGLLNKKRIKREIVINAEKLETRVAVVEDGRLEELLVEHPTEERIVGSIFKGRIQNLEHDLHAAFVDIGMRKNAFLHYWDMVPDDDALLEMEGETRRQRSRRQRRYSNEEIEKRFAPGSEIIVQVTKGAIGTKGPRVTANLSIPGRYLVMMPGSKLKGVSRKIEDGKERQRLKKLLARLPVPEDIGLIVRTAAQAARKSSVARDLRGLVSAWEELRENLSSQEAPACVYHEPDLVTRVVRDWLTEEVDRIVVDSKGHFERIRETAGRISRRARSRIHMYEGDLPIFDHYEVEPQIAGASRRRVELKSGGYVVFDETEAMIAVDVNTGRHKGKGSQEDAILDVNTEAVEEVARQLRLRNVGGIVVIDLIDMKTRKHQNSVYRSMRAVLKRDRARTNVLPISDLGLMEMTRQRVEQSIRSSVYMECPYCKGQAHVKSALGVSVDIQRQLAAILRRNRKRKGSVHLQVIVHPKVLERLRSEDEQFLLDLESEHEGKFSFKSDPSKHMAFFAILDVETNEVLYSTTNA